MMQGKEFSEHPDIEVVHTFAEEFSARTRDVAMPPARRAVYDGLERLLETAIQGEQAVRERAPDVRHVYADPEAMHEGGVVFTTLRSWTNAEIGPHIEGTQYGELRRIAIQPAHDRVLHERGFDDFALPESGTTSVFIHDNGKIEGIKPRTSEKHPLDVGEQAELRVVLAETRQNIQTMLLGE